MDPRSNMSAQKMCNYTPPLSFSLSSFSTIILHDLHHRPPFYRTDFGRCLRKRLLIGSEYLQWRTFCSSISIEILWLIQQNFFLLSSCQSYRPYKDTICICRPSSNDIIHQTDASDAAAAHKSEADLQWWKYREEHRERERERERESSSPFWWCKVRFFSWT